jgi:hypothetical protein
MKFTCLVISDGTKSLDEILAPYNDNRNRDCDLRYLIFKEVGDDEEVAWMQDSSYVDTFENWLRDCGFDYNGETDSWGTFINPNGYWSEWGMGEPLLYADEGANEIDLSDWCERFPKVGERVNIAEIGHCDFGFQFDNYLAAKNYYLDVQSWGRADNRSLGHTYYEFLVIKAFKDAEEFADLHSKFVTDYVITADGRIHHCRTGKKPDYDWFENYKKNFTDSADPTHLAYTIEFYN